MLSAELVEEGWKEEDRPVGKKLIRATIYRGQHAPNCELTDDGWICRPHAGCTIDDMRQASAYRNTVDLLIDIISETRRNWFRIYWTLSRRSLRRRFVDGRCIIPGDETIEQKVWHHGRTWTKRGARKTMRSFLESKGQA